MYRLLIVDNEEIIVNHLYEIFRNIDQLDLDVYKAYGGEEAIEWLHRTRIDIVLTDIDMPNINGLQLMEEIFRSWPQCKVIILTGHSEFEYVYKAIQHHDVSYILKAEDIDKVIQVVEDTVARIRKEIRTEDLIRQAKEQIHMAGELFQANYLQCLLNGNQAVRATREQFEQLSIPLLASEPVVLIMGKTVQQPEGIDYMQHIQQLYAVRQLFHRYLATRVNLATVLDEEHRFILFVQPKEPLLSRAHPYTEMVAFLKGILDAIQTACQEKVGMNISFTLGSQASTWDRVPSQYHALQHLLNYRIGAESVILLVDSEVQESKVSDAQHSSQPYSNDKPEIESLAGELRAKQLSVLEQYLEAGQRDKFFEVLALRLTPLRLINHPSNGIAQEAYYTIALSLMSYMNRWGMNEKLQSQFDPCKLMRPDLFPRWAEAADYLEELSARLFDLQNQEQKKRADHTIECVQNFVIDHLDEDLSLVRLAEQVHLNPSYLSRIYKQETGLTLTEFIEVTRLAKAKELLLGEQLRVSDVARLVGYESSTSFSRFFKKATGIPPQEYKGKYLNRL